MRSNKFMQNVLNKYAYIIIWRYIIGSTHTPYKLKLIEAQLKKKSLRRFNKWRSSSLFSCSLLRRKWLWTGTWSTSCSTFHWPPAGPYVQVRLAGGRSSYEGRLEVQVGSRWGTVCSTGWSTREAMVVCRQLGRGYAMHAINVSRSPETEKSQPQKPWLSTRTNHQPTQLTWFWCVFCLLSSFFSMKLKGLKTTFKIFMCLQ